MAKIVAFVKKLHF